MEFSTSNPMGDTGFEECEFINVRPGGRLPVIVDIRKRIMIRMSREVLPEENGIEGPATLVS